MSDHRPAPAPAKGGSKWIILVVVAVCSIGAGAASPFLLGATRQGSDDHDSSSHGGASHSKGGHGGHGGHTAQAAKKTGQDAFLPFGEVVVNLAEPRLGRYLRVKVVLVADPKASKELEEQMELRKATLKNWLIAHLSDKTLRDVTGRASINRARREILDRFASDLDPESDRLSPGRAV